MGKESEFWLDLSIINTFTWIKAYPNIEPYAKGAAYAK
jgi:hypothetical protein